MLSVVVLVPILLAGLSPACASEDSDGLPFCPVDGDSWLGVVLNFTMRTCIMAIGGIIASEMMPVTFRLMGFERTGIRARSPAAKLMALHGGHVPASSYLRHMQRIGARGLSPMMKIITSFVGNYIVYGWTRDLELF